MAMVFTPEEWNAVASANLTLGDIFDRCDFVSAGIDGGGIDDLLSVAVIGRHGDTRRLSLVTVTWARGEVLSRLGLTGIEDPGALIIPAGVDEYPRVAELVSEAKRRARTFGKAGLSCYIPEALLDAMEDAGLVIEKDCAGIGRLSVRAAVSSLRRKVALGQIRHDGSPLLGWSIGTTALHDDNNISAPRSAMKTPLMAALRAIALVDRNPSRAGLKEDAAQSVLRRLLDEAAGGNVAAVNFLTNALKG